MCLEHASNPGLTAQEHAILCLKDVDTVVLFVKTSFGFKSPGSMFGLDVLTDLGDEQLGSVWGLGTHCKVMNL